MENKFYECPVCGNVIVKLEDSGVTPFCCGQEMIEMKPGTEDAAAEKHVPVVERVDERTVSVKVGEMPHPMTPKHHICFIWLETKDGSQLRYLTDSEGHLCGTICGAPSEEPAIRACAVFCANPEDVIAVYEYCNIHGLWKCDCLNNSPKNCKQ